MEVDTPTAPADDGPVPLSFPAFLRHPGLSSRYAHLQPPTHEHLSRSSSTPAASKKAFRRDDNEGKRWLRRKENGAL